MRVKHIGTKMGEYKKFYEIRRKRFSLELQNIFSHTCNTPTAGCPTISSSVLLNIRNPIELQERS